MYTSIFLSNTHVFTTPALTSRPLTDNSEAQWSLTVKTKWRLGKREWKKKNYYRDLTVYNGPYHVYIVCDVEIILLHILSDNKQHVYTV